MSKLKKNAEDAEDHEIFDINDFTTASDWERFIVQIEELINEWKLNSNNNELAQGIDDLHEDTIDFENGEWSEKAEIIQFADEISFTLTYYQLSQKEGETVKVKKSAPTIKSDTVVEIIDSSDFESILLESSLGAKKNLAKSESLESENVENLSLTNLPPKSMADLLNKSNDFKVNNSCSVKMPSVAYWYGLSSFVLISPTRSSNYIDSENKANVVLSSAAIAINNTGCLLPIFVQVQAPSRDMYVGICEGSALKTQFQVINFNYVPAQYAYLSGLLEIFKSKLGSHLSNSTMLITISVRFTYVLQENTFIDWQQASYQSQSYSSDARQSDDVELLDDEDIYPNLRSLPFGAYQDCIDSVYLSCVWQNLSEDIIVDNDSYSDLNPLHSTDWSLTVNSVCEKCDFQLANALHRFLDEMKKTASVGQVLGAFASSSSSSNLNEELKKSSLQKLTGKSGNKQIDRVYSLSSNMMEKATSKMKSLNMSDPSTLPLDKGFLDYIVDYLFPDAKLRQKQVSESTNEDKLHDLGVGYQQFLKKLNLMKSSSSDNSGLLNKLATCLCIVTDLGNTKALAQVWKEFLNEIRFRYDSSILIPDLTSSKPISNELKNLVPPDLSRCLLYQKLQMINCCIKKKLERESFDGKRLQGDWGNDEESEEEFYDCEDEDQADDKEKTNLESKAKTTHEGRLKKFGDLTLLKIPNEPLYVPVTQESTPMTEDMLEQHASVLVNLGSGDDAALLRAKIQSASLLSDMQSFKAANPNCVLEDFVRWYSPRDWIEVEEKVVDDSTGEEKIIKKNSLSNRMKIPGNMWIEVWETANAVPARRQKRLFDDTKEAENVFDWLNSLTIVQIVEQILPTLFYSAIYTCYKETCELGLNCLLDSTFEILVDKAIKISRNNEHRKYQDLLVYIKSVEQVCSLLKSLNRMFLQNNRNVDVEIKEFLVNLVKSASVCDYSEVKIPKGAHGTVGKLITRLSRKKNKAKSIRKFEDRNNEADEENDEDGINEMGRASPFERPVRREYILRSSVSRPAPYSRQSPQRMYCLLTNSEFRLAGAFTEDTMFF